MTSTKVFLCRSSC